MLRCGDGMTKYKVCNKWDIDIPDSALVAADDNPGSIARPYTYYIDHKLADIGYQAWCREYLLNNLEGVHSVVEYFGGIGVDASIVEGTFDLEEHVLLDLDAGCVDILRRNNPEAERIIQGDFVEYAGIRADLAICDFEQFTMLHITRNRNGMREALGKVLSACDCCIVTGSAISRMHLNVDIYSEASDMLVRDVFTYMQAMSHCFYDLYGFCVGMVAYGPHASFITLLPGKHDLCNAACIKAPSSARDSFRRMG